MNSKTDHISIDGLSKSYKNIKALDNISFQIPIGSIFALLGPNGSGKSTLIKIFARLIRDWEGSILYNGDTIRGNNNYLTSFGTGPKNWDVWDSVILEILEMGLIR